MPDDEPTPESLLADRLLDDDDKFWVQAVDVQTEEEVRDLRKERFEAIIKAWLDGR